MGEDLFFTLRSAYEDLEPAERKVVNYILQNATQISYLSIGELAKEVNVSKTTVNRLCKKLGFKGYRDFRIEVVRYVASKASHFVSGTDIPVGSAENLTLSEIVSYVVQSAVEGLLGTQELNSSSVFESAIQSILSAREVVLFGAGSSIPIILDAEQRFTRLGVNCHAVTDSHFQMVKASSLDEKDVALAVSYSGRTASTYECIAAAKRKGARTIAITSFPLAPIARLADILILTATKSSLPPYESVVSRISQMVIIDILCAGIYARKKGNIEKFLEEVELLLVRRRL